MGIFDGGSTPGGGIFGSGTPVYAPAAKPKPKKEHWWEKAGSAAAGILAGTLDTAGHLVYDPVAEIATGGSHESKIDDIGKAILDDYQKRYSSWDDFKADPFASGLDVLTVAAAFFTGGGSLAVRGAGLLGSTGKAARIAGLARDAELTNLAKTAGVGSKEFRAAAGQREALIAAKAPKRGLTQRLIEGKDATGFNGRVRVGADGNVYVPRETGLMIGIDGTAAHTIPLSSSYLRRTAQQVGVDLSKKFPSAPVIGEFNRVGKIQNRVNRIKGENAQAAILGVGGSASVKRAIDALTPEDNAARDLLGTYGGAEGAPKAAAAMRRDRADMLDRRLKDGHKADLEAFEQAGNTLLEKAAKEKELDLARVDKRGEFHPAYLEEVARESARELGPAARAAAAEAKVLRKELREVEREIAGGADPSAAFSIRPRSKVTREAGPLDASPRNAVVAREAVARTQTLAGRKELYEQRLAKLEAKSDAMRRQIRANQRVAKALNAKGVQGLRAALDQVSLDTKTLRATDVQTVIDGLRARAALYDKAAVDEAYRNPGKHILRVLEAEGNAAKYTTEFIQGDLNVNVRQEIADGTLLFKMTMGREPTAEEAAKLIVRPHTRAATKSKNTREVVNPRDKKPSAPKDTLSNKPDSSSYSSGYNFQNALDSITPLGAFKAFNQSRAYRAKINVLRQAAQSGIKLDDATAVSLGYRDAADMKHALRDDYEFVGGDRKLLDQAHALQDKIDNEVRLVVGEGVAREQASQLMQDLVVKYTDEAGEWAIPKAYHKALTAELRSADSFIQKLISTPTAIFRAAVLNLRPAWMVNNFVGQMFLLMYSQGIYHGVREYMTEISRAVKAGELRASNPLREYKAISKGEDYVRKQATIKPAMETAEGGAIREKAGALTGEGGASREFDEAGRLLSKDKGLARVFKDPRIRMQQMLERGGNKASLAAHTLNLVTAPAWTLKGLADYMGRVNTVITDDMVRRAGFMAEMRPILKRIDPDGVMPEGEALRIALADDTTAALLVDKTMGDLIDFSRMSQAERDFIKPFLPFYSWMKGITLRTGRIIKEQPATAALSYQVGKQYSNGAEDRFGGPVPDYLRGALRVGGSDKDPRIVSLGGANSFQTPADLLKMGANVLGKNEGGVGSNPLSMLNPVVKAPIEVFSGKDMFFGGPLYSDPSKGIANPGVDDNPYTPEDESTSTSGAIARRYLSSLGPLALYQRQQKAGPHQPTDRRIIERTARDTYLAYLGLPIGTLNLENAAKAASNTSRYGLVQYDPSKGEKPFAG